MTDRADRKKSSQNPPPKTGGSPIDPEAERKFRKIKAEARENEKKFMKRFKDYEPYDLKEIGKIIQKVKSQTKKETNTYKLSAFHSVQKKIDLIIKNSRLVYELLEKDGSIDDPEYYYTELDIAGNLKTQFELEIEKLQLESAKQAESAVEPKSGTLKGNISSEVNSSIPGTDTSNENMTVKEVAERLNVSTSKIYHMIPKNEIPVVRIGKKPMFPKSKIDDWINNGGSRIQPNKGSKKKHHFQFIVQLEPFTNVFVQKEYLDEDNATLMNDRFSKIPKKGDNLIHWKKDLRSLMTFIYLADRLGFIDKSIASTTREHNTSSSEEEEEEEKKTEEPEVKFQVLVEENFKIASGGSSNSSCSRAWKDINAAINELREQVAVKKGIEKKEAKKKITRKEAIMYVFKNKDGKYFRIDPKIDKNILDIACDISKKMNL